MRIRIAALLLTVGSATACSGAGGESGPSTPVTGGDPALIESVRATSTTSTTATSTTTTTTTTEPAGSIAPAATDPVATSSTTTPPTWPLGPLLAPRAAVWESAVDPERVNITAGHPVGQADGITSAVDMFAVTPLDADTAVGRACRDTAVKIRVDVRECLIVQFRFSVAASLTSNGELIRIRATTAGGIDVAAVYGQWGVPGTLDAGFTVILPGAAERSVVYWSTGTEDSGYTEFSAAVPAMMLPVDWLGVAPPTATATTSGTAPEPSAPAEHDH